MTEQTQKQPTDEMDRVTHEMIDAIHAREQRTKKRYLYLLASILVLALCSLAIWQWGTSRDLGSQTNEIATIRHVLHKMSSCPPVDYSHAKCRALFVRQVKSLTPADRLLIISIFSQDTGHRIP